MKLTGTVERVIFRNDLNDYTIVKLTNGITVLGTLPNLMPDEEITVDGKWVNHSKYGRQLKVEKIYREESTNKQDIINFLASGIIKGIRTETALAIVKEFGEEVFDVFNNHPEKLLKIHGIGKKRLEKIKEDWKNISNQIEPIFFLIRCGISLNLAKKIYKVYGIQTEELLKKNPYRLIRDIAGIGFEKADRIAENLGFRSNDKERVKAWMIYFIDSYCQNGNVYILFSDLFNITSNKLGYQLSEDDNVLYELEGEGEIVIKGERIYLSYLYYAEREVETRVKAFAQIRREFDESLLKYNESLSDEQREAVYGAFTKGISIITGGPGTGKTTSIKSIYDNCQRLNLKCLLAAPTGRAAKRISEIIGAEAKTIHRLLEYSPMDNYWNYNEDNPLEVDILIVDEISMVDLLLFYRLITAVPEGTSIVLLGDTDQLPAIGPGNIMNDLIHSGEISVQELNVIFRQEEGSGIVKLSSSIKYNSGVYFEELDEDVEFIEAGNGVDILEKLKNRFSELVKNQEFDPIFGTQIISSMYKGEAGVDNINIALQKMLNPLGDRISDNGNKTFRINDKVMQLVNNYTKNVFNGDIGIIQHYDRENKKVYVSFENNPIEYDEEELDELKLAYAVTVHKSQGSEYDCVILIMDRTHSFMLTKNLIYTAITRAKKKLIIIGSQMAFLNGIRNIREEKRNTSLFHY